ncbi:hypothetical protein LshimejAT787_0305810 [Lyophyllum shimeji]|uniref:DUF7726 domain-containing protein n=1 Tax=Lyophyllum shimeji TaxID=47721 RepID=A0A9P3UK47_LYOSH|nr:hypothetical protein LshimejAT787_0305810 [Lyophyllum shimeji]
MAPKRKSDAIDVEVLEEKAPVHKKARSSDASAVAPSSNSQDTEDTAKPKSWKDIKLEGEDEECVPVYDDCAEVRRKINLLLKTPGFKITHWLKEIGDINSNSYRRFMKEKGKTDGASNGTYYAAYVYFEKVRILEGKKKTAKRISNEESMPNGFPLENRRRAWVFVGRR